MWVSLCVCVCVRAPLRLPYVSIIRTVCCYPLFDGVKIWIPPWFMQWSMIPLMLDYFNHTTCQNTSTEEALFYHATWKLIHSKSKACLLAHSSFLLLCSFSMQNCQTVQVSAETSIIHNWRVQTSVCVYLGFVCACVCICIFQDRSNPLWCNNIKHCITVLLKNNMNLVII